MQVIDCFCHTAQRDEFGDDEFEMMSVVVALRSCGCDGGCDLRVSRLPHV